MKTIERFLIALQLFVGIGALAGGMGAILNPNSPMGVSVDVLKGSPFTSFLIPGLILFCIIGLGSILSALTIIFKTKLYGYIINVFSWALVIWIVVQCIIMWSIHVLHAIFFGIGAIEVVLSTIILFKLQLFPANLIQQYNKKINKERTL